MTPDDSTGNTPVPSVGEVSIAERNERFYLDAWFTAELITAGASAVNRLTDGPDRCDRLTAAAATYKLDGIPETIPAGALLEISSRNGRWAALEKQQGIDGPVYASEFRSIRTAWPDDATLEVPGDLFPHFPPIPLDRLSPLEMVIPSGSLTIPTDGHLQWVATGDTRDRLEIVIRAEAAGGVDAERTVVHCRLADDGDFVIPDNLRDVPKAWLGFAARVRTTVVTVDNATLTIEQVSEL